MSTVIDQFGNYIAKEAPQHPERVRRLLLTAYRLFGWYQKKFPDKRKTASKVYLADASMRFLIKGFSHPENTALVSIFMPCEILQAFGISAMCAEMFSTYLNGAGAEKPFIDAAEAAGISETYCSYHKVLMGASILDVLPATKYVINTSLACDANNLSFRSIAHSKGIPQFYLDVPYAKNEASVQYVADQLKDLASKLEEMSGRPLNEAVLAEAVNRSCRTIQIMMDLLPLRKERYVASDLTSELYEALMMHNALGTEEALTYAEMLKKDYENAPLDTGRKIVWMHTNPFWQKAAKDLLNYNPDHHVIATELAYDVYRRMDPSDPWHFMAERLVYDPYNGPVKDRIAFTKDIAEQLDADGVVLFCHWGCKETCGASRKIKSDLEAAGFPTLILNGDGVDRHNSSDGQVSTRLGAFIEMLEAQQ